MLLPRHKMVIFVCGHNEGQLLTIPNVHCLRKINLSDLPLDELQNNQLSEHRVYLTDIPQKTQSEYIGFATWRWNEKWHCHCHISLENLNTILSKLSPNTILCPRVANNWLDVTTQSHPGIEIYLKELSEHTQLPLNNKPGFWANNFICHKSVYLGWQKFFRENFYYFHKKYEFDFDFYVTEQYQCRLAAVFYERFSLLYFTNRDDLKIESL